MQYKERMKALNTLTKLYIWLKKSFVDDILFRKSPEHMQEILEQFRRGNTSVRSKIEIGIKLRVTQDILANLEKDVEESSYFDEFIKFKKDQLLLAEPKPWDDVDEKTFDSNWQLFINYLEVSWEITASSTHYLCYLFMIINAISSGGFIYMVYPCMVFGVALM
jgi:hypothetical protein